MIELVPVSLWRNSYLVNRDKNRQVCAELNQKFYLFKCTTWQKNIFNDTDNKQKD